MNCEQMRARAVFQRYFGLPISCPPKPARSRGHGAVTVAPLHRGESLTVSDGEATTIRIDRGEVWLTEDGGFIDHVLCGGQTYMLDRPGTAIVSAQVSSRVTLYAPRFGAPPARIVAAGATLYQRPLWWKLLEAMLPTWLRWPARR